MPSGSPLLAGLRVLDLSSVGPASRASRILADYGATVIKVAPPARKASLQLQPPYYAYGAGRGMKRVRIDLKAAEGRAALLRLAAEADVLLESFRPGVAARIGIGYDDVRRVNERVVYCSTSGYGQDGPYSGWAGHDLNYLAIAGFLHCTGRRADGGPALPGATVADSAGGGMQAVIAILAALLRCRESGTGAYLDVSVAEGVVHLMALHVDRQLATGEEPGPGGDILTGRYACYDLYRARDGKWIAVGAIEPAFFANLCRALGLEGWIPHQLDDSRQDEIRADLARVFAQRDRDAWVAELGPANACVAPVNSVSELARDRQFLARKVFLDAEHPQHGSFRQVGPVLAGGDRSPASHCVRDGSLSDSDELLRRVGISDEAIAELRRQGVVD